MKTYLYHLEFPAGAHFGRQGIGLEETRETVPSDSLFSGIVNALALLGEAEEVLRELNDQPPHSPSVRFFLSVRELGTAKAGSTPYHDL